MTVDLAVITWHGVIDLQSLPAVVDELDQVLILPMLTTLIIDLSEVAFLDSLGLGTLVRARNRCSENGTELLLRGVAAQTRMLLRSGGLDDLFTYVRKT